MVRKLSISNPIGKDLAELQLDLKYARNLLAKIVFLLAKNLTTLCGKAHGDCVVVAFGVGVSPVLIDRSFANLFHQHTPTF